MYLKTLPMALFPANVFSFFLKKLKVMIIPLIASVIPTVLFITPVIIYGAFIMVVRLPKKHKPKNLDFSIVSLISFSSLIENIFISLQFFEIFVCYHCLYIPIFFFCTGLDTCRTVFNPYMQIPNLPLIFLLVTTIISMLLIIFLHIFNYRDKLKRLTRKGKIVQFIVMLYSIIYNIALFNFGTLFLGMTIPTIFDSYYASKILGHSFEVFLESWFLPLFMFILVLILGYFAIIHCNNVGFLEDSNSVIE